MILLRMALLTAWPDRVATPPGFANFEEAIAGKWLELIKELAPSVARVGFIYDPTNPAGARSLKTIKAAASSLGVEVSGAGVHEAAAIESAIAVIAEGRDEMLIVRGGSATVAYRERIIALAAHHRLPALYPYRYFAESGGLASYGIDTIDLYQRAAS